MIVTFTLLKLIGIGFQLKEVQHNLMNENSSLNEEKNRLLKENRVQKERLVVCDETLRLLEEKVVATETTSIRSQWESEMAQLKQQCCQGDQQIAQLKQHCYQVNQTNSVVRRKFGSICIMHALQRYQET